MKKKKPSKARGTRKAPRRAVRKAAESPPETARGPESGFRSAVGLYVLLVAAGLLLIWLFRGPISVATRSQAVRSAPAVIAPASAPMPVKPPAPAAVAIPAPQEEPAALEASAPAREFWSWRYDEGVTGLTRSGDASLQEIAGVLKDRPNLVARIQVGAASSNSRAEAMAAERAALVARRLQDQGVAPNQVVIDPQGSGQPRQGSVTLESR